MRRILSVLTLLGLVACAGTATQGDSSASFAEQQRALEDAAASEGIYPEQRSTRVAYLDHKSGVKIGLLNEANVSRSDYYSRERANADYKVIPNLDMGALLKQLDEFGFFTTANMSSSRVRGAKSTVQVDRGGQVYTLAFASGDPADRLKLVQDCALAVRTMYNAHQAYQIVDNQRGAEYFDEIKNKLETGN